MRLRYDARTALFYTKTGEKLTRRQAEAHFDDWLERRRLLERHGRRWQGKLARATEELDLGGL